MKAKSHQFEIEIAKKYGVDEAIILHNMAFWIGKNLTDNVNIIDGYCWTFITLKKLQKEYFPYWKWQKIQNIMSRLEEKEIIRKGCYNYIPTNRTTWYTIIDKYLIDYYDIGLKEYNIENKDKKQKNTFDIMKINNGEYENQYCTKDSKLKDSKLLSKDSNSDLNKSRKKLVKKYNPLNNTIYDFIKDILLIEEGLFRTKLPKNKEDKISKVLSNVRSYLFDIINNDLNDVKKEFNKDWIKDNNIKFNYRDYKKEDDKWGVLLKDIKKAIRCYVKMHDNENWPYNKNILTKDLDNFFYDSFNKKSWFLYCLNNCPKLLRKTNGEKNSRSIFPKTKKGDSYLKHSKQFLKEVGKDRWNDLVYWKKIKELWEWYDKYDHALLVYNQGNYQSNCDNFSELLDRIKEFNKTWKNNWTVNNFGKGNKTWYLFVDWMKKEKGVELEPEKHKLLSSIKHFERNHRKVINSDIIRKELKGNG